MIDTEWRPSLNPTKNIYEDADAYIIEIFNDAKEFHRDFGLVDLRKAFSAGAARERAKAEVEIAELKKKAEFNEVAKLTLDLAENHLKQKDEKIAALEAKLNNQKAGEKLLLRDNERLARKSMAGDKALAESEERGLLFAEFVIAHHEFQKGKIGRPELSERIAALEAKAQLVKGKLEEGKLEEGKLEEGNGD